MPRKVSYEEPIIKGFKWLFNADPNYTPLDSIDYGPYYRRTRLDIAKDAARILKKDVNTILVADSLLEPGKKAVFRVL